MHIHAHKYTDIDRQTDRQTWRDTHMLTRTQTHTHAHTHTYKLWTQGTKARSISRVFATLQRFEH